MLPSPLYKRKTSKKVVVQRPLDKVAFSFLYFKDTSNAGVQWYVHSVKPLNIGAFPSTSFKI